MKCLLIVKSVTSKHNLELSSPPLTIQQVLGHTTYCPHTILVNNRPGTTGLATTSSLFLVVERNSTSEPVCLSVCLSVCLYVPNFVPIFFFTSSRRSLRWMSLTKAEYLLQQENKIYYGWLSWAVPHSDLN